MSFGYNPYVIFCQFVCIFYLVFLMPYYYQNIQFVCATYRFPSIIMKFCRLIPHALKVWRLFSWFEDVYVVRF